MFAKLKSTKLFQHDMDLIAIDKHDLMYPFIVVKWIIKIIIYILYLDLDFYNGTLFQYFVHFMDCTCILHPPTLPRSYWAPTSLLTRRDSSQLL